MSAANQEFNSEALQVARQYRGMTQGDLAKAMSLRQASVSRYESGVVEPSEPDIEKMSTALSFPRSFFMRPRRPDGAGATEIYHRKRQKAPIKELNRIYAEATIRRWVLSDLLGAIEEPPSFPFFPIEEYSKPDEIAMAVRAEMGIPEGPVRNLTRHVERAGGIVMECKFKTRYIDGFSRRMTSDAKQVPPLFFLNMAIWPDRWRFTLAHELGHIVMHSEPIPGMEQEANMFAAEFLMPARQIKGELWNLSLSTLPSLKLAWGVAMSALVHRAEELEMIPPRKARNLYMQLSKAGYKQREPVELDPPQEHPEQMRRILSFYREHLEYSDQELERAVGVGAEELNNWYGTPAEPEPFLKLVK